MEYNGGSLTFCTNTETAMPLNGDAIKLAAAGKVDARSAVLASQPWQQCYNHPVDMVITMRMFVCLFVLFVYLLHLDQGRYRQSVIKDKDILGDSFCCQRADGGRLTRSASDGSGFLLFAKSTQATQSTEYSIPAHCAFHFDRLYIFLMSIAAIIHFQALLPPYNPTEEAFRPP